MPERLMSISTAKLAWRDKENDVRSQSVLESLLECQHLRTHRLLAKLAFPVLPRENPDAV